MKKRFVSRILGCLVALLLLVVPGCGGGNKVVKQDPAMAESKGVVVREKPAVPQRPEWTNQTTFYEDGSGFHFTGGVMGGSDYALTLRLAKSEAVKNLLESIEIKARSEFSSAMHGNYTSDDIGRYVTDTVAWTVETLRVGGIRQRNVYYEESVDPITHRVRFNTWVNLEVSRSDFIKAKMAAAERFLKKAIRENDAEAKEKALELLERLRTEA
ncbi:MAG: hypothetical protein AB2L22_13005 [Syntrophales bacterium]